MNRNSLRLHGVSALFRNRKERRRGHGHRRKSRPSLVRRRPWVQSPPWAPHPSRKSSRQHVVVDRMMQCSCLRHHWQKARGDRTRTCDPWSPKPALAPIAVGDSVRWVNARPSRRRRPATGAVGAAEQAELLVAQPEDRSEVVDLPVVAALLPRRSLSLRRDLARCGDRSVMRWDPKIRRSTCADAGRRLRRCPGPRRRPRLSELVGGEAGKTRTPDLCRAIVPDAQKANSEFVSLN